MLPYWFLFLVPAFAALGERPAPQPGARKKPGLALATLVIAIIVGLRYQVGADWYTYVGYLFRAQILPLVELLELKDPGYNLINWLAAKAGSDIWLVNLTCAMIFAIGLVAFARLQPRPWLAILTAIPYLVIVVAMGYTRQSLAIGFAFLGFVALIRDRSNVKFVFWIALAAACHRSAVILVPIAALAADRGRLWTAAWVGASAITLYFVFLESDVDSLVSIYIEAEYESQGAAIRVAMNAVPAAVFLATRRHFGLPKMELNLWTNISLLALASIVALVVSPSSTAVDRVALYLIPLQIFVLSRVPDIFGSRKGGDTIFVLGVLAYSATVQFVWMNFGSHADAWLPYQFYPFAS